MESALLSAETAYEKRATDITVLDLQHISSIADYFVICTAANSRQLQTIVHEIRKSMKARRAYVGGSEGLADGHWVLLDLGSVIVHLFLKETRDYYDLEMVWADAKRVDWQQEAKQGRLSPKHSKRAH